MGPERLAPIVHSGNLGPPWQLPPGGGIDPILPEVVAWVGLAGNRSWFADSPQNPRHTGKPIVRSKLLVDL
jgi:hypothetical protein